MTHPMPFDASGADTIELTFDAQVARVSINRPERHNAINLLMAQEFVRVVRRIASTNSVRAVLICGRGDSLSVGGDIDYFQRAGRPGGHGEVFRAITTPFHEAIRILSDIDAPVVTVAHGAVAGGGLGFLWASDIVIAAESARFVTAFIGLGVSGDGGGTWFLPRLVGMRRAAEMYLLNRPLAAREAYEWGVVTEVVPDGDALERGLAVARELAAGPTRAFASLRRLLRDSFSTTLEAQLRAETDIQAETADTIDACNAITAFTRGVPPTFKGA